MPRTQQRTMTLARPAAVQRARLPLPLKPSSPPLLSFRFCKKRFYGENELFTHMHSAHEQCFLCRRAHPNKFVYYRDYPDLESECSRTWGGREQWLRQLWCVSLCRSVPSPPGVVCYSGSSGLGE